MQKGGAPWWPLRLFCPGRTSMWRPDQRRCLLLRWCYDPIAADGHDTEVIATVLLPAGFVVLGANRALLAVRHEVEAICRNAVVNEVPLGACRTALAEGQVVLVGATLVSVTLDTDSHARVSLQPGEFRIECSGRIRSDRRLVEVEVDRRGDSGGIDRQHWCHASRIGRRDVRVVLAHCRRRRRWRRRGRSDAVRARSWNALEAGVRAHNLRTCTTQQEAQSATKMNVHVRVGIVIRHVVEDAVKPQRGAIGDAKTNARQGADAEVVLIAKVVVGVALEAIAGARATRAEDELALPVHETEREVVIQAHCERVSVNSGNTAVRRDVVVFRRVVAVTFKLPTRIGEKHADTSTVADTILGYRDVFDSGVVVKERPLDETT